MFVPRDTPANLQHISFEGNLRPGRGTINLYRWQQDVDNLLNPDRHVPELERDSMLRIHYPTYGSQFYVTEHVCNGTFRDLVRCIFDAAGQANVAEFQRNPANFKVGQGDGHLRAFVDTEALYYGPRVGGEVRSDIRVDAGGHDVFVSVQS